MDASEDIIIKSAITQLFRSLDLIGLLVVHLTRYKSIQYYTLNVYSFLEFQPFQRSLHRGQLSIRVSPNQPSPFTP
jgi:hypothetical protein